MFLLSCGCVMLRQLPVRTPDASTWLVNDAGKKVIWPGDGAVYGGNCNKNKLVESGLSLQYHAVIYAILYALRMPE